MVSNSKGFDVRIVDFSLIHNHKKKDAEKLLEIINPKQGQAILDAMSGYGAVALEIFDFAKKNAINLDLYLLDESKVQIERSKQNLLGLGPDRFVKSDIRKTIFSDAFFDTVIIKMGIHELPKKHQKAVFKEVFRILKKGGKLVVWDLSFLNPETQKVFQDIIRKKDRLAGFDELVRKRYFPRRQELFCLFKETGFESVSVVHKIDAKLSMRVRESELVSKNRQELIGKKGTLSKKDESALKKLGKKRCDALVSFAKKYMKSVPANVKLQFACSETKNDIHLTPNKEIIVGYKN
ncbi:MAG: class I SAM-dependent methyltransferase [Candidatus ainarchaeum sp.]|nr:class I SAM-dependent methyltransferase [Candidatus ainarchaeum sp.]